MTAEISTMRLDIGAPGFAVDGDGREEKHVLDLLGS